MLPPERVDSFLAAHPGWQRLEPVPGGMGLSRAFRFATYPESVAFVMAIALVAERRDHHPDISLSYGRVSVFWSTHDAGGISRLDVELAEATDALAERFQSVV
ncbi:MAG: 4a-hydroxytetrahydrobiopterin dehydratase [Polyangiaceae bacterium]